MATRLLFPVVELCVIVRRATPENASFDRAGWRRVASDPFAPPDASRRNILRKMQRVTSTGAGNCAGWKILFHNNDTLKRIENREDSPVVLQFPSSGHHWSPTRFIICSGNGLERDNHKMPTAEVATVVSGNSSDRPAAAVVNVPNGTAPVAR
ncbi:hypothetical protein EVAR_21702_1 [Eumeta japonica]|uniref:Uncharacterized protein n=1 Tax=Eumeta variegata TaxID=151549 RepID=A0A4C1W8U9_EUMVA|nr:hypothetical protein EVAR_21702_1 [Eumeta japonica]